MAIAKTQELHGRMADVDQIAALIFQNKGQREFHMWGVVASVNADGSYEVRLNDSDITTRCARCVAAQAQDRVLVLVMGNGQCVAMAKVL
ncbi:MAG: hypothetical protein Q4C41_03465 [Eggerthellaceae bacterium]|nr:hypothetical protein [Eggerthellaceae bacterium]